MYRDLWARAFLPSERRLLRRIALALVVVGAALVVGAVALLPDEWAASALTGIAITGMIAAGIVIVHVWSTAQTWQDERDDRGDDRREVRLDALARTLRQTLGSFVLVVALWCNLWAMALRDDGGVLRGIAVAATIALVAVAVMAHTSLRRRHARILDGA